MMLYKYTGWPVMWTQFQLHSTAKNNSRTKNHSTTTTTQPETMKLFIAIVVLAFVAAAHSLSEEQKQKLAAHHKECLPSSGVSEELVKKMRAGEFTEDDKLKEYVRCMFVKVGFMNDAGEIQLDVIKAKIPDDVDKKEAEKVIESCKEQKGTDAKGTAYVLYQCYRKTAATPITL